jgi:hypothetical protein
MSTHVHYQFYKHPSITAVLAHHLADNYVKPDAALGTKIANLEKVIKNINGCMDGMQANFDKDKNQCTPGGKQQNGKNDKDKERGKNDQGEE